MNNTAPATSESRYASIRISAREWSILMLSLIPAALFAFGGMIHNQIWLSIYTPLFHLTILSLAAFSAGKRRPDKISVFLLGCAAALTVLGFVHHNLFLCCANCFAIPLLTALSMMRLCGVCRYSPLTPCGIWETIARSLRGLFEYIPLPFAKLIALNDDRAKTLCYAVLSLCFCIPVLIVVLALLSSSDAVFLYWCGTVLESIDDVLCNPSAFRILLMLSASLIIFSWMFTLRMPGYAMDIPPLPEIHSIFPSMLLPMLNVIYALFVYIQFSNLFGGAETAAMSGGYAGYARTGFFQLVAVSFINLALLTLALRSRRTGWVCAMAALLVLFTGVILFSAFWRMRLYVDAFGLSVLRILTLWGMLLIAVLLIVIAAGLMRKGMPVFSIGLVCTLILWVGLNAIDIDLLIAEYNVSHYLSGDLEQIDLEYLRSLSASANAVVDELEMTD